MKPYVGVPYVYITRDREKLESLLESGKAPSKKDGLKLTSGHEAFLSFTSEFRYESAGESAILAKLELLDKDRKFETFFLSDAIKIGTDYGPTFYFAFGIGNSPSPIHAMTFIGLVNRDDNKGLRKITMEFVTGAGGSPYDIEMNGLQSYKSNPKDKIDLKTPAMGETERSGNVGQKRTLRDLNDILTESIIKLGNRYVTEPIVVLMPNITTHISRAATEYGEDSIAFNNNALLPNSEYVKAVSYLEDLGYEVAPRITEISKLKEEDVFSVFVKTLVTDMVTAFTPVNEQKNTVYEDKLEELGYRIDMSKVIDVVWNDEITATKNTLKAAVRIIFNKINNKSDYHLEPEMVWISDPKVIKILKEATDKNDKPLFPQLKDKVIQHNDGFEENSQIERFLIIGDTNTINSILYGVESNLIIKKIIIENNEEVEKKIETTLDLERYLEAKTPSGELMYVSLWKYFTSVLIPSKDNSIYRSFFEDKKVIKSFLTNFLGGSSLQEIDDIIDVMPLFKYNVQNSNVLSMSIEKDNQFFATLLSVYNNLQKADSDLNDILPSYLKSDKLSKSSLTNSLGGNLTKRRVIELYILSKYNDLVFTAKVKTLPLFTFSTPSIIGTGLVGLVGNGIKQIGKYNQEPSPLDRVYTGLWNIFGYKHTISTRDVSSEFTLVRRNSGMFNSGFLDEQVKEAEFNRPLSANDFKGK